MGAVHWREEHRHLLALAFEGTPGGHNLLGQIGRGIAQGLSGWWEDGIKERAWDRMDSDAPQSSQNLNCGGFSNPHCGQPPVRGAPHSPQNFMLSGFSNPQLEQCMSVPSSTAVRVARVRAGRGLDACH